VEVEWIVDHHKFDFKSSSPLYIKTEPLCSTGSILYKMYKQEKFDIILMDLTIKGGMGGEQCIQKLKTIDSNIRAIVYSGYSDSPVMKEYEKYGFKAVLKKPFRIVEFKDAVEKSLN
jgi:DNA-binding NtrC family response regulator